MLVFDTLRSLVYSARVFGRNFHLNLENSNILVVFGGSEEIINMGEVDIEEQAEILAEQVEWDEEKYSYDEFFDNVRSVVEDVANDFYKNSPTGEIDDWDMFEQELRSEFYNRYCED